MTEATADIAPVPAAFPPDEAQRVETLRALRILDTPPEDVFEQAADLACAIAGAPISLINLGDSERYWFKAHRGTGGLTEAPRAVSFCPHAILGDDVMWVEDALEDVRFARNPLVVDGPKLRFYAGAPIRVHGYKLGTVCVHDVVPHGRDERVAVQLTHLAAMVSDRIAARRSLNLLDNLVETTDDAVIQVDGEGMIRFWNTAAEHLFGHAARDAVGRSFALFATPELLTVCLPMLAAGGARQRRCEASARRAAGDTFPIEASLAAHDDGVGTCLALVIRDISERRAQTRAMTEALEQAKAGLRAKQAFIGQMSDELRNPMNGVVGALEVLTRRPLDPMSTRLAAAAHASAGEMTDLVNGLLTAAREAA